jgi:serine/threonine protein kinase
MKPTRRSNRRSNRRSKGRSKGHSKGHSKRRSKGHSKGHPKRAKKAGEFIKAGSYGCVFRPALKCKSDTKNTQYQTGYISKLMNNKAFNEEVNSVEKISTIFETGGDDAWVNKYFIVPKRSDGCSIDIKNVSNKRFIHNSNVITKRLPCDKQWSDIAAEPESYKLLNMPDGGIDFEDYLKDKKTLNSTQFNVINNALIDLLENGISKMNNFNIYHLDIKPPNMVYNETTGEMRLIDWGFVQHINKGEIHTPRELNRTLNNILPIGTLYYGAHFGSGILSYDFQNLKVDMAINFFTGHLTEHKLKYLKMYLINPVSTFASETQVVNSIANNYKVIIQQSKMDYFKHIFLPNSDIFAFILIYLQLYNRVGSHEIKRNIEKLIKNYVLSDTYSSIPYNIEDLVKSLQNLGTHTTLLDRKLDEGIITPAEYTYLLQMRKAQKVLSLSPKSSTPASASLEKLIKDHTGNDSAAAGIRRTTKKRRKKRERRKKRKSIHQKR